MILALGTVFGFLLARRIFAESCLWLSLALSFLLGLFTVLLSGALLLQYLPWGWWKALVAVSLLLGIWRLKQLRDPPESFRSPTVLLMYCALCGCAVVVVFCWFHQAVGQVVDGDFFIHGANIGLFARGYLPPVNPFLGIPMHGHYGRDLAIAIFVNDTGLSPLTAEWVLTTLWQALSFLVLFFWIRRETDDDWAAVLGSGMAFFGMNFSAYCGLSELLANNNPIAFCLLIVVGWLTFRVASLGPVAWIGAGLLLGLDAMIYENHFGVLGLALVLLMFRRPKAALVMGVVALVTAGLLSGVLRSTARGAPESGTEQTIRIRLFKKQIFAVRTDNLRPSRAFETKARPWAADFSPDSDYHTIWSRPIMNSFWYPVWLLPLSTFFLAWTAWRYSNPHGRLGVWWAMLAWLSLLTPALADFGFFEAETARWLVVTALGAAVALALMLASCWRLAPRFGRPVAIVLLALCSVGFQVACRDIVEAYRRPGSPLPIGRPGLAPGHGLLPNPQLALQHHYGISAEVLEAADWIKDHSERGQYFLGDSGDLPPNARGTLIGATGLLPAMEAFPPVWSRSVNSYQTNLQQRGFWATGDLQRLDPRVDWLLVWRTEANFGRPDYENGGARVYRVAARPSLPPPGEGEFALDFLRNGVLDSPITLSYRGPERCLFELRFVPLGEQEFLADENIQRAATAEAMVFVTPYALGEYRVEARLSPQKAWQDFGTFTTTPDP